MDGFFRLGNHRRFRSSGSGVLAEALLLYLHVTMRLYKLLLCVATTTTPLPPITLAILTKPSTAADINSLVGKPIHSAERPEVYLVMKDTDSHPKSAPPPPRNKGSS